MIAVELAVVWLLVWWAGCYLHGAALGVAEVMLKPDFGRRAMAWHRLNGLRWFFVAVVSVPVFLAYALGAS